MFYPLSKITPNLHTSGNEYFIKETQQDYKGDYYSAYDGRFFTAKVPSSTSAELIKYSSLNIRSENYSASQYNKITNNTSPNTVSTTSHHPTPDPTKDSFQRFFIKRVNGDNSSVREVSKEDFNNLKPNPLYTQVEVTWLIKGKVEDTTLPDGLTIPGVVTKNYKTILKAEKQLPGLLTFTQNFAEFLK